MQLFVSYVLQTMGVQTTACIQAEHKQLISHAWSSHWIASLGQAPSEQLGLGFPSPQ